ncbi:hypothetical protein SEA_MORTYSMITH_18 [Microbacterium phage MortySmith]|nr:hypothetical protein SEA_AESIR_19 [Microbacterium phage Aesir]WNM68227.1 hypothetical protein SEA_JDAWG_19 [Microbacterium phage JDawG]WNM69095.1 hypothetical protein SEA_ERUDITE_19 [Microbacterium phage Erudite]
MATPAQIAEVRANTQEYVNVAPYTDEYIGGLIDSYGITETEHKIWIAKRNTVANLVDISEGGSSRKNSQLFEAYNKIVAGYEEGGVSPSGRRAPRTRAIERA